MSQPTTETSPPPDEDKDKDKTPVPPVEKAPEAPLMPPPPVHHEEQHHDTDRLGSLETIVDNLTESVTSLIDALAPSSGESKPTAKPWTHWGRK